MLSRRDVLQRASFLLGYAVTGSAAAAALSGCSADRGPAWAPRLFTPDQAATVRAMADHLLPATSTPGAADLDVERFIDAALKDYASAEDQRLFVAGLAEFDQASQSRFSRPFTGLSNPQKDELFLQYEQASGPMPATVWGAQISAVVERPAFYRQFKQLALVGYFASEQVGEKLLAYDPIPGAFTPCMPLSQVGKAWSL